MLKKSLVLIIVLSFTFGLQAQEIIDKVIAVVGNEIILKSEIENQFIQIQSQGLYTGSEDLKCDILEELMFQKLLYLQAIYDSTEVTQKEVDTELDRRLSVFINQLGDEKKLEEFYGKSIVEIRSDFRDIIKEQILTQKVQASLTAEVKVTPSEVKAFFDDIPKDSLPTVEPYFEISEIVITPEISEEQKNQVMDKLNGIRDRIVNGESFATMAILYSEDPGSATKGGELGFVGRNDLVPEFASVAFNLTSPEEVSRVVETEFGFHIIQMIEKKGNMMNFRHILLTPKIGVEELTVAETKMNEIYDLIKSDSISFEQAVEKYSDGESRFNQGKVMNQYYGNAKLSNEFVDPYTAKNVSTLKIGEYSKPFLSANSRGGKVMKIVKLDVKVDKHIANLKDDYQEIQQYALEKAKQDVIEKWINTKLESTFVEIDESYCNCKFKFGNWNKKE
ncbi:MAG: peptidylprolyl isomerase [Bacteroidales bacterium]|nr:peptidylprolyl isomerase [Bacteroidales bacterium]